MSNPSSDPNGSFCPACGNEVHPRAEICPACGVRIRPNTSKSRIAAALLAFFLGGIGIHKFYLGRWGQGLLYLLFCWTFIPALISLIEFIIYLFMSDERFSEKYDR